MYQHVVVNSLTWPNSPQESILPKHIFTCFLILAVKILSVLYLNAIEMLKSIKTGNYALGRKIFFWTLQLCFWTFALFFNQPNCSLNTNVITRSVTNTSTELSLIGILRTSHCKKSAARCFGLVVFKCFAFSRHLEKFQVNIIWCFSEFWTCFRF